MTTLKQAEQALATFAPFSAATLSAKYVGGYYLVFSYDTEIARIYSDESGGRIVEINPTKYSPTTSKHANIVRKAWQLTQ